MTIWELSYYSAFLCIEDSRSVPYYLISRIRNEVYYLSIEEKRRILHYIISSKRGTDCFLFLKDIEVLVEIFPYLYRLIKVPQNKGKSKNAFDHTLAVFDLVDSDNYELRWAALFHDLGKSDTYNRNHNFLFHQEYSYTLATVLCDIYKIRNADIICSIVRNHMYPLDYQRNPNWTDEAINRFIDRCGGAAIQTIELAYYDKQSENNYKEYLKIIDEFKIRVRKKIRERQIR